MTNNTKMPEPMSEEEMIDTLKGLVFGTFDRTTAKEREALDMAIKALEQQPNTETHGSTYGGVSWGGTYKPQQPCEDVENKL